MKLKNLKSFANNMRVPAKWALNKVLDKIRALDRQTTFQEEVGLTIWLALTRAGYYLTTKPDSNYIEVSKDVEGKETLRVYFKEVEDAEYSTR